MQLIKKFLTDDDDSLKEVGAVRVINKVYDQTGFDAIDSSEEIYPKDTQQRVKIFNADWAESQKCGSDVGQD